MEKQDLTVIHQHHGLKKVGGTKSYNFLTGSYKFQTEEIMGAQNCNFFPKFL